MKQKKKVLSRQERGLGKYDAPLKLQFNQGITLDLNLIKLILFLIKLCNIGSGKEVITLLIINRQQGMSLEDEAKKFMQGKNKTFQ